MESGQSHVTELREKFNKLSLITQVKPRSSSMTTESTHDVLHSNKNKIESTNQISNCSIVTMNKQPILTSSDDKSTSNEPSALLATILNQSQGKTDNQKANSRQPPIPPPRPINMQRKNSTTLESLPINQNLLTTSIPVRKKPPVSLLQSINKQQDENTSSNQQNPSNICKITVSKKSPVPLPSSIKQERSKSITEHSTSVSQHVPLDQTNLPTISNSTSTIESEFQSTSQQQTETTSFDSVSLSQYEPFNQSNNSNFDNETTSILSSQQLDRKATTSIETYTISQQSQINEIENTYYELNHQTSDASFSDDEFDDNIYYDDASQLSLQLPTSNSNTSTISFETILPLKSMFYDFETIINNYQRRNPGTIFCSTNKPLMPKLTTNDIHILQRYSNT